MIAPNELIVILPNNGVVELVDIFADDIPETSYLLPNLSKAIRDLWPLISVYAD